MTTLTKPTIDLMDIDQTAGFLGLSNRQVRHAIKTGALPHIRVGYRIFCRRGALEDWIARLESQQQEGMEAAHG